MAKLHPDTVRLRRRYHNHGYSVVSLAEAFGLSRSCVHGVVSGKTHRNVTQDAALPPLSSDRPRQGGASSKRVTDRSPGPLTLTPKMRALISAAGAVHPPN